MFDRVTNEREGSPVVKALLRRWWVIVLVALIAGAVGYELSNRQAKKYTATSGLLFLTSSLDQQLLGKNVINTTDPTRDAATNQALVELPSVAKLVAKQLNITAGRVLSDVSYGSDTTSDVLTVSATDENPVMAARIANSYVEQYIVFRKSAAISQLDTVETLIRSKLAAIPSSKVNGTVGLTLITTKNELDLLKSAQTGNAQVVQTAGTPSSPSFPKPSKDGLLGLVLGFLVGGLVVALFAQRDRRIKTVAEVETIYGVPVIGMIPESRALRGPGAVGSTREQEAFRMMRAQLRYFDVDRDIRRVAVTSADVGEGKSMISLNLARAAARGSDKSALLIEADLRRPSLGGMIGVDSAPGLAELLSQSQDLATGLRELVIRPEPIDEQDGPGPRFDVLLAGGMAPNPVELLESRRMVELLDYADGEYDLVVIDTPPIGVVSDPIPLVHQVDGVIVVSRMGRSRRDHAARLMKQLRGLNALILGVAMNSFQPDTAGGYEGYYAASNGSGRRGTRSRR
jgi:polysaccharide biosynthesis transport protein